MVSIHETSPLVSVIVPTFNRADMLTRSIGSVLEQTFHDFELIVIDDGSTDATKDVIENYGDQVRYFYQTNSGVAAARNLGIQESCGTLITFLDSDDVWKSDKLQIQIDFLNNQDEFKVCYSNEIWIRNGAEVKQKKQHQKYSGWIYQQCLPACIISASSVMIHREVLSTIGLFDEEFTVCEDYDLWLRISHRFPIKLVEKPLIIKYDGHGDQLSHKYWGMDEFRVQSLLKILGEKELSVEDRTVTVETLLRKCQILANGFLKRGKEEQGKYYLSLIERYDV